MNLIQSLIIFGLIAGSAAATTLLEETFDYEPGSTLGSSSVGGIGFNGGYYEDAALSRDPGSVQVNYTAYPDNLAGLNLGLSLKNMGTVGGSGAECHRAISDNAAMNMDSDSTYYISFTYKGDGSQGGARMGFGRGPNATLEFRQVSNMKLAAFWSQRGAGTLETSAFTKDAVGDWNFIVVRVDFSAKEEKDRIRFNVYSGDDVIEDNDTWQVDSGFFKMQGGSKLNQFYVSSGGRNTRFGNIRIGTSFSDVAAPAASEIPVP